MSTQDNFSANADAGLEATSSAFAGDDQVAAHQVGQGRTKSDALFDERLISRSSGKPVSMFCFGQLGLGDTNARTTMTAAGPATTWRQASATQTHTCGVREDGTLWCSGQNSHGELGLGDTTDRSELTRVGSLTNWLQASTNDGDDDSQYVSYSCALRTDATLWCWGDNDAGQLGQGNTTARKSPKQVGALTTWATVSVGAKHTCALHTDRSLWCWGRNGPGQLGQGDSTNRTTPVQVPGISARALSAGSGAQSRLVIPWPS